MTLPNLAQRVTLGRTGLVVSRMGLASGYGVPAGAVERAYNEYGVNYFFLSSPRRNRGMIEALKHLGRTERGGMVVALQSYDHWGVAMRHFVQKGLASLDMEYADILILGWFGKAPAGRVLETAQALKEEGLIRHIGMSGHNRRTFGELAAEKYSPIDVMMFRYNAVHRGAETDIFPHLPPRTEESGPARPGTVSYTATCWSKLLKQGKMPPGEQPLTAAECYRFVLNSTDVDVCLTGPRTPQEMDDGLRALAAGPLTQVELERMRRIGDYIHKK